MITKTFKQITKKDVDIAGGKGASLGEMTNAKMKIPKGFIVLASTFDSFLKASKLVADKNEQTEFDLDVAIQAELNKVNYKDINTIDRASNVINDLINDAKCPKDIEEEILDEFKKLNCKEVAVRSSATAEDSSIASWAGELETYLNVKKSNLLSSVKKCWASLFTPRAIFYRYEKNLNKVKVSVAVVVQKMVQSDVSGICFTAHPVTNDRNQMVLEAGFGLGEAIVGGMITPDTYIIDKNNGDPYILDKNISEQKMMITKTAKGTKETKILKAKQGKQKLSDAKILKLAGMCLAIEKHYKKPQDIEWAMEKNILYITQSRPITTL